MFKCKLSKQIHGDFASVSSADVYLEKKMELPFAPFAGLIITGPCDFEATVKGISYDLDEKIIHLYTEEDKEIYNAQLERYKHRPIEEIVAEYIATGWEKEAE